ncbi:MAG: FAD-binding protein [Deltaproteobacteria bacterium]|nr:FAD-binding protein [Deltaproteobacteria bacterium]
MTKDDIRIVDADVLVIGSGIAGLRAAMEVSRMGGEALLVSKSPLGKANNTYLAGGLFSVAHGGFDVNAHMQKTLGSGRGINNRVLVRKFVTEAPHMIEELRGLGMRGRVHPTGFATRESALLGGPQINSVLLKACREGGVRFIEGIMITDLIVRDQACFGAIGFHKRSGDLYGFRSGAVMLATGGAGAIYAQNDNAPGMTGDGYALGLEAGLELIDMEFVQFYPLVYAGSGKARMIIPALFADAGRITNNRGEDLKQKYGLHEKPVALVSRDRLAQALFREIREGNDVDGALLLDLTTVEDKRIPAEEDARKRLRKILSYDTRPVRITPACHHTMGGIVIDEWGRTAIENLFAAGEVVGGIHGANRMGGNALSEALVFGVLGARKAAEAVGARQSIRDFDRLAQRHAERNLRARRHKGEEPSVAVSLMETLRRSLWQDAGIARDEKSLNNALQVIDGILAEVDRMRAGTPQELQRIMECRNAALSARSIVLGAVAREETRGSHYRDDFPDEEDRWMKNIHVGLGRDRPEVTRILPVSL